MGEMNMINQLRHEARILRKGGAIGRADLMDNAANEIEQLQQRNAELLRGNGQLDDRISELDGHLFDMVNERNKAERERDELSATVERFCNVILSDRFPDNSAQQELLWMATRGKPNTSLAERDAEMARKAFIAGLESSDTGEIASEYAERVKRGEG